ncbi:tetratricopeptide repeat protein [Coprococcus catus]|uniref:tetratricopeptide repeat protein n=1 Tax=Coprococcus catus TaxID=116085 RepID=UPI0020982C8F|nr:tetratricopeptide repeat protein [Coprococcus catus]MCO7146245.1 tetratricopeptide repeat protein [Coprococcus catus]
MENNKINEGALTKQIKTLVMQERYEEAMKVLDEIEVSKIRNISILCLVGEVYMGLKRYDEAEQILLRVYEKNPNTRRILDLLTTLYIDKGEYSEAEYYYKEFIGVASRDLHRYILRYRLDKGKGERLSVLIDTLEKLKDYEYIEEWAYELATLYEASGETKKCIHECDEIVLWFGHGEYVDKAIALKCKLTGEPLPEISTVEQHRVEEEQRAAHEKQLTESIGAEMGIEGFAGADYEGSIDLDLIQRAMDGAAPEAADEPIVETAVTEDTLRDEVIVEEPVLEENEEPTLEENEESAGSAEGEETQDAAMAVDAGNTDSETVNADGNTADDDGHAESADEDSEAEQPDEENEKSHIAHLFSSLMFGRKEKEKHFDWSTLKLAKEKGEKPDEIELAAAAITAAQSQESQAGEKDEDIFLHEEMPVEEMSENTVAEDAPEKEVPESEEAEDAAISTEGLSEEDADFFGKLMGEDLVADYTRSQDSEEEIIVDDDGVSEDTVIIDDDDDDSENEAPEAAAAEDEIIIDGDDEKDEVIPETKEDTLDDLFGIAGEVHEDELVDDDDEDEVISEDDSSSQNDSADEEEDEDDEEDEISDDIHASDTVLDIFGTVTGVESIKSQLAKTFTKFEDPALDNMDLLAPYDINFVVTGYDMSVKSQIAIGIAKALNTYGICDKNKLVRATAQDLNGRDFSMIFEKLKGGCLIIDGAGMLDDKAAGIIVDFVQQDNQDVAIVLEGEEDKIKELFRKYPVLHSKFLNIIHIGKYNENELVQLAEGYAKKKGYEISGPGAASLKTLLRERMQDGYSVDYEDIMAIIEEAIASLEKRNMKNLFMTVLDNKYEEAAMFMLQPEDFKNINIPD